MGYIVVVIGYSIGVSVTSYIRFMFCSMETITLGDKRIGIKTSVLEEKATACNMLCCYADELKEGFYPWIDQVWHLQSLTYSSIHVQLNCI